MKKWKKIIVVVVAGLVALAVALIVLANVLITPERVKAAVLPLAEDSLNRKIDLGRIEVSFFSGIEIHDLTVYEADSDEVFLSTELVRLRYQLLPLLVMKVVVDEARLVKPTIRVVRLHDGAFNFSDLLHDSANAAGQAEPTAKNRQESQISLLVSQILVEDGQLTFLDHVLNDNAPHRFEVSALQIAAKGVSLTGKVPLSIQCQFNGSQLAIDGELNLLPLTLDFDLSLQELDVVALSPYLQGKLPGTLNGLKLNLTSKVSGTPDQLSLKGSLKLKDLDLLLEALPEAPLQKANLQVEYDLTFAKSQELLELRRLDFDYNGIKIKTKGEVTALFGNPALGMELNLPGLGIRQAVDALPKGLLGDISSLDPAGSLSATASLSGRIDDPVKLLKSAIIELDNVQASSAGLRPAFTGRLLVTGDQVASEKLQVRIGDNSADINLVARSLYAKPVIVKADVSSKRFLLEPLLQGGAGSAVATNQARADKEGRPPGGEIGPFDLPVQANGKIVIAEALWKGLVIHNFIAQYELKDNILNLSRIEGQVAGGSFSNSARVDLRKKGLNYSAKVALQEVQSDPLVTAFAPDAAGTLSGAMNLSFALDGQGTQWQSLSRKLSGDGDLLIADGRLISSGLVGGLSAFLQLPELNDIQFNNFSGEFKVGDGKVKLDSRIISQDIKLFPKGTIGLDGSLNLALDTRLSPKLSAKIDRKRQVANYLRDSDGWTRMPLLVKGNFDSPSFGLDPKGVQEQATKAIGTELGRQLDNLLKGKKNSQKTNDEQMQNGTTPAEAPAEKLLQDSLKKLFGN